MFCQRCGSKLAPNKKICPNCGMVNEVDEYCGGFWGLVAGDGAGGVRQNPSQMTRAGEHPPEEADEPEEGQRGISSLLSYVCIALMLATVGLSFWAFRLTARLNEAQQINSQVMEAYEAVCDSLEAAGIQVPAEGKLEMVEDGQELPEG